MKIRIYSPYFPHPVTEGAYQTIFDQVCSLAKKHEVELVTWKPLSKYPKNSPFFKSVKWVDWSSKVTNKNETPLLRVLRILKSLFSKHASPELFYYPPEADLRAELGSCDLAIYHYSFSHSWLSRKRDQKEKKVAIHFHNLESDLFFTRAGEEKNIFKRMLHILNAKKLKRNESAIQNFAEELWQVSPKDLKDFAKYAKIPQVLRPPTYDVSSYNLVSRKKDSLVFGFIGGLNFDPNRSSLEWLIQNVFPLLKSKNFSGQFLSVGKMMPDSLLSKTKDYSFYKHLGFVEDIESFWEGLTVMCVPHTIGSGVRMKLLEALARGIPVVANTNAIDRIHPELKKSPLLFCADNPKEWCDVLLSNELKLATDKVYAPERALTGDFVYGDLT